MANLKFVYPQINIIIFEIIIETTVTDIFVELINYIKEVI